MAREKRDVHGVLLLNKPKGVSSNHILQRVKHLVKAKKAGHTGALDPLATGMLPICFGQATKFSQYLLDADKTYLVTAKLGERTNTSDAEGEIVSEKKVADFTLPDLEKALDHFRGEIKQTPSIYSALKYQGKPLYYYARQGIDVPRPTRNIHIFNLQFIQYQKPFLELSVHCSKGTYIRSLVDDLGELLGCGAHVTALHRCSVGSFKESDMLTIETIEDKVEKILYPIETLVSSFPKLNLSLELTARIRCGQKINLTSEQVSLLPSNDLVSLVALFDENDSLIGMGEISQHNILSAKRLIAL